MAVAKKYQEELPRLKKLVEESRNYFDDNNKRFHALRNFLYNTTMDGAANEAARAMNKPTIEFNTMEAYQSRLKGEYADQEPSIGVSAKEGKKANPKMIELVEDHVRALFYEGKQNDVQYLSYDNCLSGGFSVYKVYYDYANEMSFEMIIKWECQADPTMSGFDPMARKEDKHDGRYCFELFPKTEQDLKDMGINTKEIQFSRNVAGFDWSYEGREEKVALVCDFYEKKNVKTKIVQIANGKTMTMDDYVEFKKQWEKTNKIVPAPIIVQERYTNIVKICRYRFIETEVLSYCETLFTRFPLIFVDGSSALLRRDGGTMVQMTRPYHYNGIGTQKLKNLAGQNLANEMENMVMHKFKVAKESIPPEYMAAYANYQCPNTIVYNAMLESDPNIELPPPMEIARVPAPPEIFQSFMAADQTMQTVFGSYDAALGINSNQLSGDAIDSGSINSNSAAKPYITRQIHGLNSVAQCWIGLLPKLYVTPRSVPVIAKDGNRAYQSIGGDDGLKLDYDENTLDVKVEAGVSFAVEKSRSYRQLVALMQVSPDIFGKFMASTKVGLNTLLDNMEIKGIDVLKPEVDKFIDMINKEQQQQQQAEQNQQNPMMLKAQNEQIRLQMDAKQNAADNHFKTQDLALKKLAIDDKRLKDMLELKEDMQNNATERDKAETERLATAAELAISHDELQHTKRKDLLELAHTHLIENAQLAHDIASANKSEKNESSD